MLTQPAAPSLPLVASPLHGRLCESCRLHRARLVMSWPDARFEVCLECVPAPLLDDTRVSRHDRPACAPRRPTRNLRVAPWWWRALTRTAALVAAAHLPSARTARDG